MAIRPMPVLMALALLAACSAQSPEKPSQTMPGSDRDAHGCIASAGYRWCGSTGKCERSWELAREKGFDNSAEAFDQYCRNPGKQAQPSAP